MPQVAFNPRTAQVWEESPMRGSVQQSLPSQHRFHNADFPLDPTYNSWFIGFCCWGVRHIQHRQPTVVGSTA